MVLVTGGLARIMDALVGVCGDVVELLRGICDIGLYCDIIIV